MPRKSIDRYLGMVTIYNAGLDFEFVLHDSKNNQENTLNL